MRLADYIEPVNVVRYAEAATRLVNANPADADDLRDHLRGREHLSDQCTDEDATVLTRFVARLREVFEAADADDVGGVVDGLNSLLRAHSVTPMISDHGSAGLHLDAATTGESVADHLIGEALLGLASLVCDPDPNRLGVCASQRCVDVFVDTSPNRSRRYCSERCSSRANVAAYRARQRAASA